MSDVRDQLEPTSTEESDRQSVVLRSGMEDPRATRIFKMLHRLAADEVQRYKRGQLLVFPFFVTDEQLKELRTEVLRALEKVPSEEPSEFVGSVRFQDLSSQRFDQFEAFLEHAGKRKDPESIRLVGNKFAVSDDGEPICGRAEISFVTEKRLATERANPEAIHTAEIDFVISGSDQPWVNQLFDDILPNLRTTAHAGIMKPLWVFRNATFVQLASVAMGYVAFILESRFLSDLLAKPYKKERLALLQVIKTTPRIEQKFDSYIAWLLTPTDSSMKAEIVRFLIHLVAWAIGYIAAKYLLPMLTPNSAIAIGVARRRAISSLDTFKFVIFTVLVGSLLLPMLTQVAQWIF